MTKKCIDCKHSRQPSAISCHWCIHPSLGEDEFSIAPVRRCRDMRGEGDPCGPNGNLFETKPVRTPWLWLCLASILGSK